MTTVNRNGTATNFSKCPRAIGPKSVIRRAIRPALYSRESDTGRISRGASGQRAILKGLLRKIQSGRNPANTRAKSILSKRTTRGRPPSLNMLDLRAIQRHRGDGRAEQRDKIRHGTKAILLPDEFHSRWVNRTKCPVQLPAQLHWAFWNYCYKNLNFANIFLVRETTFFSDFSIYKYLNESYKMFSNKRQMTQCNYPCRLPLLPRWNDHCVTLYLLLESIINLYKTKKSHYCDTETVSHSKIMKRKNNEFKK